MDIERLAGHLDDARRHGREVERLTLEAPDLDLAQAYRVMDAGIAMRLDQGEKVIGLKMGLTSEAKRRQMSLEAPIYGVLTDAMVVRGTFHLQGTLHPKIEPEIAFRFARGLQALPTGRASSPRVPAWARPSRSSTRGTATSSTSASPTWSRTTHRRRTWCSPSGGSTWRGVTSRPWSW